MVDFPHNQVNMPESNQPLAKHSSTINYESTVHEWLDDGGSYLLTTSSIVQPLLMLVLPTSNQQNVRMQIAQLHVVGHSHPC